MCTRPLSNKPTKEPTTFFTLPAELRNHVYELVFTHDGLHYKLELLLYTIRRPPRCARALLEVNRQIRFEALPVFWGLLEVSLQVNTEKRLVNGRSIFCLDAVEAPRSDVQEVLRKVGRQQCGWIRLFRVKVHFGEDVSLGRNEVIRKLRLAEHGVPAEAIRLGSDGESRYGRDRG